MCYWPTARTSIWQHVYTIIFHRLVRRFEREGSALPVGRTPVNEQFSGRLAGETSNLFQVDLHRQQETRLFTSCRGWRSSEHVHLSPLNIELDLSLLEYYQLTLMSSQAPRTYKSLELFVVFLCFIVSFCRYFIFLNNTFRIFLNNWTIVSSYYIYIKFAKYS